MEVTHTQNEYRKNPKTNFMLSVKRTKINWTPMKGQEEVWDPNRPPDLVLYRKKMTNKKAYRSYDLYKTWDFVSNEDSNHGVLGYDTV